MADHFGRLLAMFESATGPGPGRAGAQPALAQLDLPTVRFENGLMLGHRGLMTPVSDEPGSAQGNWSIGDAGSGASLYLGSLKG